MSKTFHDLSQFPVMYEELTVCPFDEEIITDRKHAYRDPQTGERFHSKDEAQDYAEALEFEYYEQLASREEALGY